MSNKHLVDALVSLTAHIKYQADLQAGEDSISAVVDFIAKMERSQQSQAEQAEEDDDEPKAIHCLMGMLEDERYTLRSLSSLAEKSGLYEAEVCRVLNDNYISFIVKTSRDGKKLIGLASRN